jgi:GT2 family glycosyltransferase
VAFADVTQKITAVRQGGHRREEVRSMTRFGIAEIDFAPDAPVVVRVDEPPSPARYLLISRVGHAVVDTTYTPLLTVRPTDAELVTAARAAVVGDETDRVGGKSWRPATSSASGTTLLTSMSAESQAGPGLWPVVIVCTHGNPDGLRQLLDSLAAQTVAEFDVVVVDNAPHRGQVQPVMQAVAWPPGVSARCLAEPRAGLSIARNTGLRAVEDENTIVAWLDDDETAEPHWLEGLLAAFTATPTAWAVSGTVLPAELATPAQQLFEVYGGHTKGHAFTRKTFTADTVNPLLPLPPFGVGANFAARAWVFRHVGGFDEALGAGTATRGGEDTLLFSQMLLAGGTIVYEPAAVTRHRHRRELSELAEQFVGYGRGLTAFYVALLWWRPRLIVPLVRSAPAALLALRNNAALSRDDMGLTLPREVVRAKYCGYLAGPWLYVRLRLRNARARHGR